MKKQHKNTDKIKEQSKEKKTTPNQNVIEINNNAYCNNDNNSNDELSDFDIALKKIIEFNNN